MDTATERSPTEGEAPASGGHGRRASPDGSLTLSPQEIEILEVEAGALLEASHTPESRERHRALLAAIQAGEVPAEAAELLGQLCALSLESGRALRLHGPGGARMLASVYGRTPAGAAQAADAAELTRSLQSLLGSRLDEIRVVATGPGAWTLTLDTERCQMIVRFDRQGARVESVAIGV